LLAIAVFLIYGQTRQFDFINFDDTGYVSDNAQVQKGLTLEGIAWAFRADKHSANWHPLTWISLMLDCQLYGPKWAGGFHLTNALLHAANSMILLLMLRQMTRQIWPSALVAAVFAVHPLHVESVAWVTERKDVLSGFFGLLAIWAYAWYARRPGLFRYLTVAAALALGLMAKSSLVTWPLLLLLLDYWPLRRPLRIGLVLEKIPLMVLAGLAAVVTFLAQRAGGAVVSTESAPIVQRVVRAGSLYVFYLGKTFWPRNLAMYTFEETIHYGPAGAAVVLVLLITAAAIWAAWPTRRVPQRWLAVGWFWYLGTLVPTIGLVQVGMQVKADRFVYLPQIGICIALVWAAVGLLASTPEAQTSGKPFYPRAACCIGVSLLLAVLAALAWQQASYWRDSEALWSHALGCTSRNFLANFKLARAMESRGDFEAAVAHYRAAVEIRPRDAAARNNLGSIMSSHGNVDGAIGQFEAGVEFNPSNLELQFNLATLLAGNRQFAAAIPHYEKVLEIAPNFAAAKEGLARARAGAAK
jgi:tetratricopeptide (TPR) repeat protein